MPVITSIVKRLLLINVVLFLAQSLLGLDLIGALGLRYIASDLFRPYQLFTHLFVHANLRHLFGNMFALLVFGPILEHMLTSRRFVTFYLFTGVGAAFLYTGVQYLEMSRLEALYHAYLAQPNPESLVAYLRHFSSDTYNDLYPFISSFFEHPDDLAYVTESKAIVHQLYTLKANIPTVGASGAVFGILTAFAMLFPNLEFFLSFISVPIQAKYVIAIYGVYELYAGVRDNPTDNVAHFAHLGGILLAYLFIKWWRQRNYH